MDAMHLYETIQNFPVGICISGCRITPVNATAQSTSAFTLKSTTQVFPGAVWKMDLEFLPMEREDAGRLESFLLSLRGQAGKFRMGDPFHSLPLGQSLGQPVCAYGNAAGEDIIKIKGFSEGVALQLMANDKIQVGDHYYSVLADVGSCPDGCAEVRVWPPLRQSYTNDTPIITRNARAVWRLAENVAFDRNNVELHSTSLSCIEAL